jgi:hypothetical protein
MPSYSLFERGRGGLATTGAIKPGKPLPHSEGTTVLKKMLSILGLALALSGAALWSGESRALAAGGASRTRFATTAHDCPRPRHGEETFGPYWSFHQAEQKCHSLEREGWCCRMEKCDECRGWYVFARRSRR